MSKEKQIEEMAYDICVSRKANYADGCRVCSHHESRCLYQDIACSLYTAGYRKQSENMVELPCKVGDSVWCIYNYTKPKEFQIAILTMSKNHYSFTIETKDGIYKHYCDKEAVGKWVFFTKEGAEEVLAKMKGE